MAAQRRLGSSCTSTSNDTSSLDSSLYVICNCRVDIVKLRFRPLFSEGISRVRLVLGGLRQSAPLLFTAEGLCLRFFWGERMPRAKLDF